MTGYTAELVKKNLTFPQWVALCCRAMGATITMRDDPLDAPIPDEFSPSDYHLKALREAEASLEALKRMTKSAQRAYGQKRIDEQIAYHQKGHAEQEATLSKMRVTLDRTKEWNPPTPDHEGLKKFMLQQLTESIEWDGGTYHREQLAKLRVMDPMQLVADEISSLRGQIASHDQSHRKEVERCQSRTAWVKAVRESLK